MFALDMSTCGVSVRGNTDKAERHGEGGLEGSDWLEERVCVGACVCVCVGHQCCREGLEISS